MKNLNIKKVEVKKGAVVIADVHYKKGDKEFIEVLKKWIKNPPAQVFFLGDIFHLLLPFSYLKEYNSSAVLLINKLAEKTEVYYTPGNHDFNIETLFENVVFADAFYDEKKNLMLTHGDLTGSDFWYGVYVKLSRNRFLEKIFHIISLNFYSNWLFKKILKKRIVCKKIKNFENIIKEKLKSSDFGIIIEGHYHQNVILHINDTVYVNLPAFVCTKSYILIQLDNNTLVKEINYDGR